MTRTQRAYYKRVLFYTPDQFNSHHTLLRPKWTNMSSLNYDALFAGLSSSRDATDPISSPPKQQKRRLEETAPTALINKRKKVDDLAVAAEAAEAALAPQKQQFDPSKVANFVPRVVCRHFIKGFCQQGDKCNFKHPEDQAPKQFVPRVVCRHFAKGDCRAGDKCTFKHELDGANMPDVLTKKKDTKNIVCQFAKQGACCKGDECEFSHDFKLEPCKFFHMEGKCNNGDECLFSHEPLTQELLEKLRALTGPCRFWLFKGYCKQYDTCKFGHDLNVSEEKKAEVGRQLRKCQFFFSPKGCKNGDECFYSHVKE